MKGKMSDKQRLLHILDAVCEIQTYTANIDIETFLNNSMMRFASINKLKS